MASLPASQPEAIDVRSVSKSFVLPHERKQTVKQSFTSLFRSSQSSAEVQHALQGISFSVQPGEFFGIVGRNGSGKSTLLKLLAGIYQPSKGSVAVQGKLVHLLSSESALTLNLLAVRMCISIVLYLAFLPRKYRICTMRLSLLRSWNALWTKSSRITPQACRCDWRFR